MGYKGEPKSSRILLNALGDPTFMLLLLFILSFFKQIFGFLMKFGFIILESFVLL